MNDKPRLRLDATGQFLTLPLVGPHDNEKPFGPAVERSVAQLARVSGH